MINGWMGQSRGCRPASYNVCGKLVKQCVPPPVACETHRITVHCVLCSLTDLLLCICSGLRSTNLSSNCCLPLRSMSSLISVANNHRNCHTNLNTTIKKETYPPLWLTIHVLQKEKAIKILLEPSELEDGIVYSKITTEEFVIKSPRL